MSLLSQAIHVIEIVGGKIYRLVAYNHEVPVRALKTAQDQSVPHYGRSKLNDIGVVAHLLWDARRVPVYIGVVIADDDFEIAEPFGRAIGDVGNERSKVVAADDRPDRNDDAQKQLCFCNEALHFVYRVNLPREDIGICGFRVDRADVGRT